MILFIQTPSSENGNRILPFRLLYHRTTKRPTAGVGSKGKSVSNKKKVDELTHDLLTAQKNCAYLYLDNVALSAGHGTGFYDEYETKEVFTDKEYLYDGATWIDGNSMTPNYQDGEVALIREGGFDYDGAVYAVAWNEKLYIKKVYLEDNGLRLVSINKDYPDKFAPEEDEPRIVGKSVGNFMPIELNT